MATVTTADGTEIFYKDWGQKDAQPLFFHHGWPLSADDWDSQMMFFLAQGYRVIAHDRRGHGRSTQGRKFPLSPEFSYNPKLRSVFGPAAKLRQSESRTRKTHLRDSHKRNTDRGKGLNQVASVLGAAQTL